MSGFYDGKIVIRDSSKLKGTFKCRQDGIFSGQILARENLELARKRGLICSLCTTTKDLAQCTECLSWFCREHDMHECYPKRDAEIQKRIDVAQNRRGWGFVAMFGGLVLAAFGAIDVWLAYDHIGLGIPGFCIAIAARALCFHTKFFS